MRSSAASGRAMSLGRAGFWTKPKCAAGKGSMPTDIASLSISGQRRPGMARELRKHVVSKCWNTMRVNSDCRREDSRSARCDVAPNPLFWAERETLVAAAKKHSIGIIASYREFTGSWWTGLLWYEHKGPRSPCCPDRGQDSERRQARRFTDGATDKVRAGR